MLLENSFTARFNLMLPLSQQISAALKKNQIAQSKRMEFFLLLISKVIETIKIIPIYMSIVLEIKT
jgi:hypothetical protein